MALILLHTAAAALKCTHTILMYDRNLDKSKFFLSHVFRRFPGGDGMRINVEHALGIALEIIKVACRSIGVMYSILS